MFTPRRTLPLTGGQLPDPWDAQLAALGVSLGKARPAWYCATRSPSCNARSDHPGCHGPDGPGRPHPAAVHRTPPPAGPDHHPLTPRTLLHWHAELVKRHWTYRRRIHGRPRTGPAIRRLVLEMARDNPAWGYRRICGELTGLASPAIWEILKEAGIDPAPQRAAASWGQFLSAQAKTIAAVDFFHAGTVFDHYTTCRPHRTHSQTTRRHPTSHPPTTLPRPRNMTGLATCSTNLRRPRNVTVFSAPTGDGRCRGASAGSYPG
jgi:hypothetical protein